MSPPQAKRQQRKLNFLITQTELYAHFMSGKANIAGVEGDPAQEEILRKLEDNSAQRQIDIGGGVMVNAGQEDYGTTHLISFHFVCAGFTAAADLQKCASYLMFQTVNTTSRRPYGMPKKPTTFISTR